jgi:hypothetical protein
MEVSSNLKNISDKYYAAELFVGGGGGASMPVIYCDIGIHTLQY